MSKSPLFSTYRQGENRVTSSMVAVFERIDLSLLERLLAAASGESTLEMVTFSNQPAGKGASIPDARISARFSFWFEVKTTRNAVDRTQLAEHLKNLGSLIWASMRRRRSNPMSRKSCIGKMLSSSRPRKRHVDAMLAASPN